MAEDLITTLREDLVTCTRLLVFKNVLDYSGHLSARIPGTDQVIIQPRDVSRAGLSSKDMLIVDLDGNLLDGAGPAPGEVEIHLGVYRAREDVAMVCHGHPTLSTVFSMVDMPLLPMRHFAAKYPEGLRVHQDPTHISSPEQGDAVAKTLGNQDACLLRSHGTVVCARSIGELLRDCLDLEENARTLLYAAQLGAPLLPLTPEECQRVMDDYGPSGPRANKMWLQASALARLNGVID